MSCSTIATFRRRSSRERSANPLRPSHSGLQLSVDLGDLVNRPAELPGVDDKGRDHTHGDQPVDGEIPAESSDDHKTDVADTVHHRSSHYAAGDIRLDTGLGEPLCSVAKETSVPDDCMPPQSGSRRSSPPPYCSAGPTAAAAAGSTSAPCRIETG